MIQTERKPVTHKPEMVVHKDALVVHAPVSGSSHGSSRHGVYADMDKRRAYRRAWMAQRRVGGGGVL